MQYSEESYPRIPGHTWKPKIPGLYEQLQNQEGRPVLWHYPRQGSEERPTTAGWHSRHTGDFESYPSLIDAINDLLYKGDIVGPIDFDDPFTPLAELARKRAIYYIQASISDWREFVDEEEDEVIEALEKIKKGIEKMDLL